MERTTTAAAQPRGVGRDGCAPTRARALASAGSLWLLPILLWLFGCFFYFGELYKWTDDYAFTEVDPITGEAERLWRDGHWVLWRPLMLKINSFLQTVLWQHDAVIHLIGAALHGLAAILLWRLLRMLRFSRTPSLVSALVFLTFPATYQVVFWSTAIPIGLAASLMLLVMIACILWARGRVRWWIIPPAALLSYTLTNMYEQPGAALGALPLLYLAACPGGQPWSVRLRRIGAFCIPCWFGVGLYVVLYWLTMPADSLGTPESLLHLHEMPGALAIFAEETGEFYLLRKFKECALRLGLEALREHPERAGLLLGAIGSIAVQWACRAARSSLARPNEPGPHRRLALAAFGVAAFICALVPVFLVRAYWAPGSRMLYAPAVGLIVLLALGLEAARAVPLSRPLRAPCIIAGMLAVAVVLVWFSIMQIGTQAALRQRYALDVSHSQTLRSLIPDPPPNTVFTPLFMDDEPCRASWRLNYMFSFGVWSHSWTAMHEPARLYGRSDLFASSEHMSAGLWNFAAADKRGIVMREVLSYRWGPHPYEPVSGGFLVPWHAIIPFMADEDGTLHVVTHALIADENGQLAEIEIPLTKPLLERGVIPRFAQWVHVVPPDAP